MIIRAKLTEKDFINANFLLLLKRPIIRFIICIYSFIIAFTLFDSFIFLKSAKKISSMLPPIILFLVVFPVILYFSMKRSYSSNKRISETIEYQFDKDYLIIKGESFNSQLSWDKIYKVSLTKNWLLIWQNRQSANVIPKKDLFPSNIDNLKEILIRHNVKNNL